MSDLTYSNPRKELVIADWPSGAHKTEAKFYIESDRNNTKQRAVRVTLNPKTGKANAPKKMTYAIWVVFADGSDGKLYILEFNSLGFITIMKGTFDYGHESIFPDNPRFNDIKALIF